MLSCYNINKNWNIFEEKNSMTITVNQYDKLNNLSFGLGQDVSQNLKELAKVASIFVKDSNTHRCLLENRLDEVVLDSDIKSELKTILSTSPINPTWRQLTGTRTDGEANSLVQAIFSGQGQRLAIVDWAAQNYVSVAVAFGLLKFKRTDKSFILTSLGKEAVELYDENKMVELDEFMYQRLLEYPYAAWLIRLLGNNPDKQFSKFDLAENFGFIDELGFDSIPVQILLNGIAQAELENDNESKKRIKSNFEGTSDKYMRWLAGVLVKAGLATSTPQKVNHKYKGKDFLLSVGPMYQITAKGLTALKQVNGGSRYPRSSKRVMWEFLATKDKNASVLKTSRSLILKYLVEKNNPINVNKLAEFINADYPKLEVTPEEIIDDCKGMCRIGIEIINSNDMLTLKENLIDFEIPIEREKVLEKTEVDKFKNLLRSRLTHINHSYLKGIDIASKKNTTNAENTEFEIISTQLFTDELGFSGQHLGGSSKPDGLVWDERSVFILDSKAYSEGFSLTSGHTDAMGRYIRQFKERDKRITPTWWDLSPSELSETYFAYISGRFLGNYEAQLKNFRQDVATDGGALEFVKLLLLANAYKAGKMSLVQVKESILDYNIPYDKYAPLLM